MPTTTAQKINLIVGVVFGLLAILLTKAYIDQQKKEAKEQQSKLLAALKSKEKTVLVAVENIPAGVLLEPNMLKEVNIPANQVPPNTVAFLSNVAGMTVNAPISSGEPVTLDKLSYAKTDLSKETLAKLTPAGKRAVSVLVDNMSSLSGLLSPGDYVDVIALLPLSSTGRVSKEPSQIKSVSLFQNVQVLAVGKKMQKESPKKKGEDREDDLAPLVTLALDSKEANIISFVQEQGKIRLILRSQTDTTVASQEEMPVDWNTILEYLPKDDIRGNAGDTYVEVYRGLNKKEKLPLTQSDY